MKQVDVLVVGGGISGLATAWKLQQRGIQIELWEASSRVGGKIATEHHKEGYITEQAASMVLNFRPEVNQFLRQTGLDLDKLPRSTNTERYLIQQGKLQQMPVNMLGMFLSPVWSLSGKLRMLMEFFIPRAGNEGETVADFIRRRFGNEILDKAFSAYISGTLASDPELVNAFSVLPHLTALEQHYGSLAAGVFVHKILKIKKATKTEGFSFQGGMKKLPQTLAQQLGSRVHTNHQVTEIKLTNDGWLLTAKTKSGAINCLAKQLILSTPAPITAKLLGSQDKQLQKLLMNIPYAPLSIVHIGIDRNKLKHPVKGTGFLTPSKEKSKLNGCIWMHSLFAERAPKDKALLSCYLGGTRNPNIINWSRQKKIDTVNKELHNLLGMQGTPDWVHIDDHHQALPLYHGHYYRHQQDIKQRIKRWQGLHLQANYLGGVSIRDRIICANTFSDKFCSQAVNG
jgi:oxygen-dependent protoporphyrinogen oxidase